MLERFDLEFKAILERQLLLKLRGEDGQGGLYRGILSCEDMSAFNRTRGEIQAYEAVLGFMEDVAKRMNENEEPVRYGHAVRGFSR